MFEGELDGHLSYDKHEQSSNSDSRNGYGKKKIRTSYGESKISVSRDWETSFNRTGDPAHDRPKRENMVDGIEEVIVSLYAKGMSVSEIEKQIRDVYNFDVPSQRSAALHPE